MKLIIILSLISTSIFAQIDSMEINTLYMYGETRAQRAVDSIKLYNGYSRQHTDYYCYYEYDSILKKYAIIIDKPTQRYLKKAVLTVFDLPTIRIPINNLNTTAKTTLEDKIINEHWNTYIQNSNIWLFHFNKSADDLFTTFQRNYIISIGGILYNFD